MKHTVELLNIGYVHFTLFKKYFLCPLLKCNNERDDKLLFP